MSQFTIVEWRKLGEALETWDRSRAPNLDLFHVDPLVDAARRDYDRWQECDNSDCEDGTVRHSPGIIAGEGYPCPRCGGSGLLPSEQVKIPTEIQDMLDSGVQRGPITGGFIPSTPVWLNRAFDKECETCNGRREIKVLEGSVFGGTSQCPDCTDDLEPPPTYNGIL